MEPREAPQGTLQEDPEGVPLYRRVLVGYRPRGPSGRALCLRCGEREVWTRGSLFCSTGCRMVYRRAERGPRPRWSPCPGCGLPCRKCLRIDDACREWKWRGHTPVWKSSGEPVHGGLK